MRLPLDEAPLKIGHHTRRSLVPVFRVFGKEPHYDGGQLLGNHAAICMGHCQVVGATGWRAMWQWTHSKGSAAANGSTPVSIWYKVMPKE